MHHLYIIKTSNHGNYIRDKVFERLRLDGFLVNIHYIPIYRHPYYSSLYNNNSFPNSENYYSRAISLPIYPGLKDKDIKRVATALEKLVKLITKMAKENG